MRMSVTSGPHGRHFIYELLTAPLYSGVAPARWDRADDPLTDRLAALEGLAFEASSRYDSMSGTSFRVKNVASGQPLAQASEATPADVAQALANLPTYIHQLPSLIVERALADVAASAAYWQPPRSSDYLRAAPAVRDALEGIAAPFDELLDQPDAIRAFPYLVGNCDPTNQWLRTCGENDLPALARWRQTLRSDWASSPVCYCLASGRVLPSGNYAPLEFEEDPSGARTVRLHPLNIAVNNPRIYEIRDEEAWVALCQQYPLATRAFDTYWKLVTDEDGPWVIPDWLAVAADYDAVHLHGRAYLQCGGRAIRVDEKRASLISGWNPDETMWITDVAYMDSSFSQFSFIDDEWRRTTD